MSIPTIQIDCKNKQQLFLSQEMQKGLMVLQLPVLELAAWVDEVIDQNPLLEKVKGSDPVLPYSNPIILDSNSSPISLFEHLMQQARQAFREQELQYAEILIGSLDVRGFFTSSISEIADEHQMKEDLLKDILRKIQDFDPPGIAASTLQESFLFQLKDQKESLAYQIIENHFDDFLHRRFNLIQKNIGCSMGKLREAIYNTISKLSSRPAAKFEYETSSFVYPDVFLEKEDQVWKIEINSKPIPVFRMASTYMLQGLTSEEKKVLKEFSNSAKWLTLMIQKRQNTLNNITEYLLKKHIAFFEEETRFLEPLKMGEVAKTLGVHDSTIARAISNKYLSTPLGIFSFKYFFNCPMKNSIEKEVSNQTAKDLIARMIRLEDKRNPLSDLLISKELKKNGIVCARRTVAKYREQLRQPPALQRKSR